MQLPTIDHGRGIDTRVAYVAREQPAMVTPKAPLSTAREPTIES